MSKRITVGELKKQLEHFPDDAELDFCDLTFYKTKSRSSDNMLIQIEFAESREFDEFGNIKFLKE